MKPPQLISTTSLPPITLFHKYERPERADGTQLPLDLANASTGKTEETPYLEPPAVSTNSTCATMELSSSTQPHEVHDVSPPSVLWKTVCTWHLAQNVIIAILGQFAKKRFQRISWLGTTKSNISFTCTGKSIPVPFANGRVISSWQGSKGRIWRRY